MSITINIEHAKKAYGKNVVIENLSAQVKPGEFFTLLGPSGCGKTTLLRMIAGFNTIEGGEIKFDDRVINNLPPHKRNIGMVFQNYAVFPHMSTRENIAFGLKERKVREPELSNRVNEVLDKVQIRELAERMPSNMSGGQQQRIALARAMVINPDVLLFDEPLSNLDAKLRAQMRTELSKLHKKLGTTFIYVTHDQTEAMTMADRIVVMKDGFIQQVETPQTLYDSPCNMFVAGFIGSPQMNFIESKLIKKDGKFFVEFGSEDTKTTRGKKYQIPLPENKNVKGVLEEYVDKELIMGIRPEDVHDEPRLLEEFSDCKVQAEVEVTELMGAETFLFVNVEGHSFTARVEPTTTARPGDTIEIALENTKIHLFDKETERTICN